MMKVSLGALVLALLIIFTVLYGLSHAGPG